VSSARACEWSLSWPCDLGAHWVSFRVCIHASGLDCTHADLAFPAYQEKKKETKDNAWLNGLPVLTVDGKTFTQSSAIIRYFGKKAKLYPTDDVAALAVDEIMYTARSARLAACLHLHARRHHHYCRCYTPYIPSGHECRCLLAATLTLLLACAFELGVGAGLLTNARARDIVQDCLTKCPQDPDAEVKKAKRQEYAAGKMKALCDLLNQRAEESSSGWMVGTDMTVAGDEPKVCPRWPCQLHLRAPVVQARRSAFCVRVCVCVCARARA
jgi:glutathione S-transferase